MAFGLAVPAVFGRVEGEGLFDVAAGAQPGRVVGCGDEFGAGEVEVAFAGPFGGKAQAAAEFEFGLEEVGLEPVGRGVRQRARRAPRRPPRSASACTPAVPCP